jgi:hypothetical protein
MVEDDSFDFSLVLTGHPIAKRFLHIKVLSIEPIFTFLFSLSAMNMNWLICFVSVEKETPSTNKKYGRQNSFLPWIVLYYPVGSLPILVLD